MGAFQKLQGIINQTFPRFGTGLSSGVNDPGQTLPTPTDYIPSNGMPDNGSDGSFLDVLGAKLEELEDWKDAGEFANAASDLSPNGVAVLVKAKHKVKAHKAKNAVRHVVRKHKGKPVAAT